jgi:hypothetical protein
MSNIQPKKQDLDGVEYLSANETTNIKISGDDSSSNGARIELGKDLTTTPIISHLSGGGFDFGVLGDFTFPQMILSKEKLQAVVTPLPATDTLKINKKILLDDGTNTGTLDINGTGDLEISSSGKIQLNPTGGLGVGGANYGGINQVLGSQGINLPPIWINNYPYLVATLPVSPNYGDQVLFNFGGAGNIGALLNMIWDGIKWRPIGSAVLCRWNIGGGLSQVINSTTITNLTQGEYGTITFTPPFTGYYEVGQQMLKWEMNSGISMATYLSATDGSENWLLFYNEDWNGPYQHWRSGVSCPIVVPLQSTKTYRFTANISYAFGNQGTLSLQGFAYVKALSS